jgi:hypothetical protein
MNNSCWSVKTMLNFIIAIYFSSINWEWQQSLQPSLFRKKKNKKETVRSVAEHTCGTPTPKKKQKQSDVCEHAVLWEEKKTEWCLWRCGIVEKKKFDVCEHVVLGQQENRVMSVNMWFCGNKKTEWCLWTCGFVEKKEQSDVCGHACMWCWPNPKKRTEKLCFL